MNLDSATLALEQGDFAGATQALWALWHQTRDPSVALAVVLADRAASPLPEGWRKAKRAEMQQWWLGHSRSSEPPLGWLAATWSQGTLAHIAERLEWLRAAPRDPRVALALSAALVSPPFHSFSAAEVLYEPMFEALREMAEPATLAQVERSLAMPPWTGEQMRGLMTPRIEQLASVLRKTTWVAVATPRLISAMKPLLLSMPDLLPSTDRASLAVAADALQEVGDPRGAVLAAQLASDPEALADSRNAAQALVAQRVRNEAARKPKKPVLDPEVRVVRDEAGLEVMLRDGARWRAHEVTVATKVNATAAARLAQHRGLPKLEKLVLLAPEPVLEALDAAPLNQTLKSLEVRGPFSLAMVKWLKSGAFRGVERRLVMPALECVMTDAGLVCRSDLAEGRPDYVSFFAAVELAPGTSVRIEREWMQEPRRSEVIDAAKRAGVVLSL